MDNDPLDEGIAAFIEAWPSFGQWLESGGLTPEETPPEPFIAFLATAPLTDAMCAAGRAAVLQWIAEESKDTITASAGSFAYSIYEAMCKAARS